VGISRVYQEPTGRIWLVDQIAEVGGGTGGVAATTPVVLQFTSHTLVRWHHHAPRAWSESPESIREVFLESVRADAGHYLPLNTETTVRRCVSLLEDQAVEEEGTISSASLVDLHRLFHELLVEYRVRGDGRFAAGHADTLRRFGMGLCASAEETFDRLEAAGRWVLGRDVLDLGAYINAR
jgi:hypothetical protein